MMKKPADISANLGDIQGNILRPYDYPSASYLFLSFGDAGRGREFLRALLSAGVTSTETWASDPASGHVLKPQATRNCALSCAGLSALGLPAAHVELLPAAFRQGMRARAKELGDEGANHCSRWQCNLDDGAIHAVVMVNALTPQARQSEVDRWRDAARSLGVVEATQEIATAVKPGHQEHFGFADGISQPSIEGFGDNLPGMGSPAAGGRWLPLKPGEFLLGYEAEATRLPLPAPIEWLCTNGTFMVLRKLAQDVAAFRRFVRAGAESAFGSGDDASQERFAAHLMGRWKSGTPLQLSPERDSPQSANDFRYAGDRDGMRCPLGAHVRRVNPRDALEGGDAHVPFHRILRRGMPYGPDFDTDRDAERGMVFVALNADIEAQFEFVQGEWVRKGDFAGLTSSEKDPIAGTNKDGFFTLPGATRNPFVFGVERFVTLRGGGYFILPGLRALERLAEGFFGEVA